MRTVCINMISRTGVHLQQPLSGLTVHSLIQKVYGAGGESVLNQSRLPRARLSAKRCVTNEDLLFWMSFGVMEMGNGARRST